MQELDNPIWNALSTRQAQLAQGDDKARRYFPSFGPLAGLADESAEAYASLAKITNQTDRVGLCFAKEPEIPDGWTCSHTFAVSQMVCERLLACPTYDMQILTTADVEEMKELVKLTQPGPFSDRTIEFGTFVGIKDGGRLVAMAGERMKLAENFDEVSAVCTHPDYQGRGYARALVHSVVERIQERGNIAFLHVRSDNLAGIRSYESVGFKVRRTLYFAILKQSDAK